MENRFIIAEEEQLKTLIQNAINDSLLNCGKQITQLKNENENENHKKFYTIKEVCHLLQISRPTLNKIKRRFNLLWFKINNLVRIPAADLDILLSITRKDISY